MRSTAVVRLRRILVAGTRFDRALDCSWRPAASWHMTCLSFTKGPWHGILYASCRSQAFFVGDCLRIHSGSTNDCGGTRPRRLPFLRKRDGRLPFVGFFVRSSSPTPHPKTLRVGIFDPIFSGGDGVVLNPRRFLLGPLDDPFVAKVNFPLHTCSCQSMGCVLVPSGW